MRGLVLALACAACGRVGFEASAQDAVSDDVTLENDEDDDGVADVGDVCPHVVGSQADADGDRVGDDCDPEPNNPRQRLVLFATMQSAGELEFGPAGWTQKADAMRLDGGYAYVLRRGNLGSVRMALGVDIEFVLGPGLSTS